AAKIRLTDQHDESGRRPIGVATEFREESAGLWGRFRFYNTPEGRGGRENVVEETDGGLAGGFLPVQEPGGRGRAPGDGPAPPVPGVASRRPRVRRRPRPRRPFRPAGRVRTPRRDVRPRRPGRTPRPRPPRVRGPVVSVWVWVGILIALAILAVLVYAAYRRR